MLHQQSYRTSQQHRGAKSDSGGFVSSSEDDQKDCLETTEQKREYEAGNQRLKAKKSCVESKTRGKFDVSHTDASAGDHVEYEHHQQIAGGSQDSGEPSAGEHRIFGCGQRTC